MYYKFITALFTLCFATVSLAETQATTTKWSHESELGLVFVGGNTESRTENVKHESKVEWNKNSIDFRGLYVHTLLKDDSTNDVSTELWALGSRYERQLSSKFNAFTGTEWDGNRDSGYDYKAAYDIGGKYIFHKEDKDHFFAELGYRFEYEDKVKGVSPSLTRSHILRGFVEWAKAWNKSTSSKFWVELLPDFSESENFQANFEPSVLVVMSELLSLKMGYLVKYDNLPAVSGNKRFDTLYTTTLVAKY